MIINFNISKNLQKTQGIKKMKKNFNIKNERIRRWWIYVYQLRMILFMGINKSLTT